MESNNDNLQVMGLCKIRDLYRSIYEFEIIFQKTHNLGLNEGMLLCSLDENKYSSNELANILGLSNSNTSKVIKSIEKKGFIERIIGEEDKRQMYFVLTREGMKKLKTIKCSELLIPDNLKSVIQD